MAEVFRRGRPILAIGFFNLAILSLSLFCDGRLVPQVLFALLAWFCLWILADAWVRRRIMTNHGEFLRPKTGYWINLVILGIAYSGLTAGEIHFGLR